MKSSTEINNFNFTVEWSAEDGQFVGLCKEFPSLSWLEDTQDQALAGIERLVRDVKKDIDAEKHYDKKKAKELITQALTSCDGSKPELARRMGMTRQYINAVLRGDKAMSYGMQVMLEGIISDAL